MYKFCTQLHTFALREITLTICHAKCKQVTWSIREQQIAAENPTVLVLAISIFPPGDDDNA